MGGDTYPSDVKVPPDYSKPFFCAKCSQDISAESKAEHQDWHLAKDLQEEENGTNSTPAAVPLPQPPQQHHSDQKTNFDHSDEKSNPPSFDPPPYPPPNNSQPPANASYESNVPVPRHTNAVIEAGIVRARDERKMQNILQDLQYQYRIYNPDIEPEHDASYYCGCPIHQYQRMKWARIPVQDMWSNAVMYPKEKAYNDRPSQFGGSGLFSSNPYMNRYSISSPYGYYPEYYMGPQVPQPGYHAQNIQQTIRMNNALNAEAQQRIDRLEPVGIWDEVDINAAMAGLNVNSYGDTKDSKGMDSKLANEYKRSNDTPPSGAQLPPRTKPPKGNAFKKMLGMKSTEEKVVEQGHSLRNAILAEEAGRWPNPEWRRIVMSYQDKVGMRAKIADLRRNKPIQYLHLLRAGYFEPIPVAWATQDSNPLKFSIEAASGWRGITPAWRGYEDTAEERLYWVLNHREGSVGMRLKPDFISEMNMANDRMSRAVEPPPEYFSPNDTCHVQHTSAGYSKQVMPAPFRPTDRPELPSDDTMILLDVSGSMDFDPMRPIYNQYLITGYTGSTQPKNKDLARAIVRRFTDAMANHDHEFGGYDLVTFANQANYIGTINHRNFDQMWGTVRIGGGTRVMTGWQKVKDLHFRKHSASATHHPVYGWQAGPETPILRLLLLLDGEAIDMDEFELDLLGLSWAHVTIFLIGVDGCPHHHRHANELQRISDVNHHVAFVDAQGNTPERFVTHELLKRHLGYDVTMAEFVQMEQPPPYVESTV